MKRNGIYNFRSHIIEYIITQHWKLVHKDLLQHNSSPEEKKQPGFGIQRKKIYNIYIKGLEKVLSYLCFLGKKKFAIRTLVHLERFFVSWFQLQGNNS